jgi:predicted nucleotidyltransferase
MSIDLEKYKKTPVTPTATPTGTVDLSKYRKAPATFQYPVQMSQQQKIAQYQNDAARSDAASREANSFGGFAKNFGKAFARNIVGSEIGLGETIAKIANAGSKQTVQAQTDNVTAQNNLQKLIRERKAAGADTSKLELMYNDTAKTTQSLGGEIKKNAEMPSTQKVLGQIGGTGLDLLTAGTYGRAKQGMKTGQMATKTSTVKNIATGVGLPELGQLATQKSKGIFTRKGIGNVLKGGAIGYGYDVSEGLQGNRGEKRDGGAAFIPAAGTALGISLPLVSEVGQTFANKFDKNTKTQILIDKRHRELEKLDAYQALKKATEKGRERGIDVKKILAETDVLHGSVDNTGTITTKGSGGAVEQYTKQFIQDNEKLVSDALKKEAVSISPDVIRLKLERAVMDAGIEGKALTQAKKNITEELAGYALRSSGNGVIPVSTLHDAKIDKYNSINFFTEGNTKKYDKTVAKALKELVEENTKSVDVQNINKDLSKHFAVIDYLNKLDGKKVDGGKLGKYFAQTVGAVVGSHFGPLGAILGAETGGKLKGSIMSRSFSGKTGKEFPTPKSIKQAIDYKASKPLELPPHMMNNTQTPNPTNPINANAPSAIKPLSANVAGDNSLSSSAINPITNNKQNNPAIPNIKGISESVLPATEKSTNPKASLVEQTKEYKTAEEGAIRSKVSDVFRLQGQELDDITIIGSTARGKASPNDLDILITRKKPFEDLTSDKLKERKDLIRVFESELKQFFPDKKIQVVLSRYDKTQGVQMPLSDYLKNANQKPSQNKSAAGLGTLTPKTITPEHKVAIDDMYSKAEEADKWTASEIKKLADESKGIFIQGPIKKREKVERNLLKKYKGDISRVSDVVRNTIVNTSNAANVALFNKISMLPNFHSAKFTDPNIDPLGYSGWNTKIKAPNGLITETQINSPRMIYAKESEEMARGLLGNELYDSIKKETGVEGGKGHKFYDEWVKLIDNNELEKAESLAKESKEYYSHFYGE